MRIVTTRFIWGGVRFMNRFFVTVAGLLCGTIKRFINLTPPQMNRVVTILVYCCRLIANVITTFVNVHNSRFHFCRNA